MNKEENFVCKFGDVNSLIVVERGLSTRGEVLF